jgi:large subunit ribosomal protein L14
MVQSGTILKICDRTGVVSAQCIKVFGSSRKRIALIGDVILVAVKRINPKKFQNVNYFVVKNSLKEHYIVRC